MKKLIIFTIAILSCIACKKTASPAPATTSDASHVITAQESALVGNWKLDKDENYTGGTITSTTLHTDSVNCHLNLTSSFYAAGVHEMQCVNGLNCTYSGGGWRINSGQLEVLGGLYTIDVQSTTNLVIHQGSLTTGTAQKYYLHK